MLPVGDEKVRVDLRECRKVMEPILAVDNRKLDDVVANWTSGEVAAVGWVLNELRSYDPSDRIKMIGVRLVNGQPREFSG
jgi:hypothetical protein